jgi:trans-aconitate methyltransferase
MRPRLGPAFFDDLYARDPDPWDFPTSAYEAAKYDATIAALEGRTYATGLEIGCSIGVLTQRVKRNVHDLTAIDVSAAALRQARERNPDVRIERREIPEEFPPGRFEMILCSEVLYYLDEPAFAAALQRLHGTLRTSRTRPAWARRPDAGSPAS